MQATAVITKQKWTVTYTVDAGLGERPVVHSQQSVGLHSLCGSIVTFQAADFCFPVADAAL